VWRLRQAWGGFAYNSSCAMEGEQGHGPRRAACEHRSLWPARMPMNRRWQSDTGGQMRRVAGARGSPSLRRERSRNGVIAGLRRPDCLVASPEQAREERNGGGLSRCSDGLIWGRREGGLNRGRQSRGTEGGGAMPSAAAGSESGHSRGAGEFPPVGDFPCPPSGWKDRRQAAKPAAVPPDGLEAQAHRNENRSRKAFRRLCGVRGLAGAARCRSLVEAQPRPPWGDA
jgi:hypothetical protein